MVEGSGLVPVEVAEVELAADDDEEDDDDDDDDDEDDNDDGEEEEEGGADIAGQQAAEEAALAAEVPKACPCSALCTSLWYHSQAIPGGDAKPSEVQILGGSASHSCPDATQDMLGMCLH